MTTNAPTAGSVPETPIAWERESPKGVGIYVETSQWRLEWNGHATGLECPALLPLWREETLNRVLLDAASKHIPAWKAALSKAEPPDVQRKSDEAGHV